MVQARSAQLEKAYILALCLQATSVLAEADEDVDVDEATEEKALLAQVMEAILNPSAEHLPTYVGLSLALSVIAGIVYMAFSKTKDASLKVTLQDMTPATGGQKKRSRRSSNWDADRKKTEELDEAKEKSTMRIRSYAWHDFLDADALYKELDEVGPHLKKATGTLQKTSFIKIKKVLARRTYLTFVKRRDELLD